MIALHDLFYATGTQHLYDGNTGEEYTVFDIAAMADREVIRFDACKVKGEYAINVWLGRRNANR